ncbi:acetylornithine aminotransferase [Carnobacterium divergens]|uniref:aminotransferase class III-fold pyridoxal phosphate-dependent enzyme n=1 Tax=Carnobacterium divergens TaxID=2748 RepID=UPI00107196C8|nr:aminotransferase class III-fold pyridoxal phosphate-dependent enzyme [Carnobacterium divergens]TFJ44235.1 acetylornithine aminotransferase [Carnobacterium divergens]TFJ50869.1 acetylornithine aminotransferase [Carnobacterium divergens]
MNRSYLVPMGEINTLEEKLTLVKGDATFVFDERNRKYIDLRSGLWNVNVGYHPELFAAVKAKMDEQFASQLTYLDIHSFHHPLYEEYGKQLLDFADSGNRYQHVIYTNSGSECTELALKMARQVNPNNKKVKTLAFSKGYHGTFWGGMSVSGLDQEVTQVYSPKLNYMDFIDFPDNAQKEEHLINHIYQHHEEYSTMVIEPVMGSAGVRIPEFAFMNKLGKLLKKYDITIIFDEVATGFYRTGKRFFFQHLNFEPDIINLSKGINNGILPFGSVLLSVAFVEKLTGKQLEHFSTQNGNLLGLISAIETLNFYLKKEEEIIQNINKLNQIMRIQFASATFSHPYRIIGCMASIEINDPAKLQIIVGKLQQFGILCYQYFNSVEDNGLTLMPSYFIEPDQMEKMMKQLCKVVKSYD